MKALHRITGIVVSIFIVAHLFNHLTAWFGIETHQYILEKLRQVYRIPVLEFILVISFFFQAFSGFRMCYHIWKKEQKTKVEKIQMYSGILLGLFIIQHIPATIGQRWYYEFDTNFYFASRVVLEQPLYFYFVPYYFIGIMAFAFHLAEIHRKKIVQYISQEQANIHYYLILGIFFIIALLILYIFMGGKYDIQIPEAYRVY